MLSGLIGAGAQAGLEELLTRQLMEAKAAEEQRQARAREAAQAKAQAFAEREHADRTAVESRRADQADRDRRDRANRAGVADMMTQRGLMDKADAEARLAEIIASIQNPAERAAAQASSRGVSGATPEMFMSQAERDAAEQKTTSAEQAKLRFRTNESIREYNATHPLTKDGGDTPSLADNYTQDREARVLNAVDDLMGKVSNSTVGFASLLKGVPRSDALAFKTQMKELLANVAFNELTAMKQASKTGGALGNVSNVELALLESALGGLDQAMSPEQFKAQLNKIRGSIVRWQAERAKTRGLPAMRLGASHDTPAAASGAVIGRYEKGPDGKLRRVGG